MYVVPPPKSSDSTGGAATDETAMLRTYQTWKGSNKFFLQGRFIFGPDIRSIVLTVFLIVAPVIVFCVFIARNLMDDFTHHSGIAIMVVVIVFTINVLVLLVLTSGRDPGIIPRNLHPPEPESYEASSEVGAGLTPQLRLPRTKDVVVNGKTVKIKYCDTCMLYRPPRCSHCSICDNCVERFDHHCPWVGQCIGKRNYRFFFMFVFSATLLCIYIHGFCWVYIMRIKGSEQTSIWRAMAKTPASIVLIVYSFISVWFVGGLSVFHLYLIGTNQSTYENFRYRYDRRDNPYNRGVFQNFKEVFCTSIPPSKNNFRAKVPNEPQIPPRMVGDGFIGLNSGKTMRDREMGPKPIWEESGVNEEVQDEDDDGYSNDGSPDRSRTLGSTEGQNTLHPRHSSWGRRSGNWDISPELGDSNRISGVRNGNTTGHE